jgi:predicted permease
MPDFSSYVRQNLPALGVSGEQEAEIVEELALEFQERYEGALRNGSTPEEAWTEVTTNARPWHQLAEELRPNLHQVVPEEPARGGKNLLFRLLDDIRQDLRYALRQLHKSPGFTFVAILTLALGIGGNTAIFGLINAVMLRHLPVRDPQGLVFLGDPLPEGNTGNYANGVAFSYPFYQEFRQANDVYSNVAGIHSTIFETHGRVGEATDQEKLNVELVSGTFFETLCVNPIVGRTLNESDDQTPGAHPVAVASYSWWQRRFATNSSVVGKAVKVNTMVYTIVGVTPPNFSGLTVGQSPDLWIPLTMQKEISPGWNGLENKTFMSLHVIARLKPGVSTERAEANTNLVARRILTEHAELEGNSQDLDEIRGLHIQLTSAVTGRSRLRKQFSAPLQTLMVIVGLVLLIACANIANLLLARATSRQREFATRMSLGAMRSRLIRQLLLESALLAFAGALTGILFAWGASSLLLRMASEHSQILPISITPDIAVLSFTVSVAIVTVFLFGTVPALQATRLDLATSLKEARAVISSQRQKHLSRLLVVVQVAFSLVLLVGSGLFLRTLANVMDVNTGFDKHDAFVVTIAPAAAGYQADARFRSVLARVEERVGSLPSVKGASFAEYVFNQGGWLTGIRVPGRDRSDSDPIVVHNLVGPHYFEAMKLPILLGRGLEERDNAAGPKVCVINETLARAYFGNAPLGRKLVVRFETGREELEVVGVVKDAKFLDLDEEQFAGAYYPHAQHEDRLLDRFVVRYSGDPRFAFTEIRKAIHEVDSNLDATEFITLEQLVGDSVVNKRLVAQLCTFFGVLAVFLVCLGIYGVMSYGVARRTNEFGIRMALGAGRGNVLWLVLWDSLWLSTMGIAIGFALSLASESLISSLLFGLRPSDPVTLIAAVLSMLAVALFAGYWPARRATRIDPMVALRHE